MISCRTTRSSIIFIVAVMLIAILLAVGYYYTHTSVLLRLYLLPKISRTFSQTLGYRSADEEICYLTKGTNMSFAKPTEQKYKEWFHWKFNDRDIFAYSAIYDDRPASNALCIRVQALSSLSTGTNLWCQMWIKNSPCPKITQAHVVKSGVMPASLKGIEYVQYLYTCVLPVHSTDIPTHVSFTKQRDGVSTSIMPVITPISDHPKKWAICMLPNFGYFPTQQIVEWLEFLKLLGVEEVNIYNMSLSSTLNNAIAHYVQDKFVVLFQISEIAEGDTHKILADLSAPITLNDCMYRNYKRYRFMVVVDLDELIIPNQFISYDQLLLNINKHHKLSSDWISYSFSNIYYSREFGRMADNSTLYTMQYRNHCPEYDPWLRPKSFVDPNSCLILFNHYCSHRLTAHVPFTIHVDPSLATNHHYRNIIPDYSKCGVSASVDNNILVFKNVLQEKVHGILSKL